MPYCWSVCADCGPSEAGSMAAHRGAVGPDSALLLQTRYHIVEAFLLDFGREVGAETLYIRDPFDHHVPGFPALGRFPQAEINRHLLARCPFYLRTHGSCCIAGVTLVGQNDETITRKVDQRRAIISQQRVVERIDEALTLLRRRCSPALAQYQAR